jgi:hypothetical protein
MTQRVQGLQSKAAEANAGVEDSLDALAGRTGAWLVLERSGRIAAHGVGESPCPEPLREALVSKCLEPVERATAWDAGSVGKRGRLGKLQVTAAALGGEHRVWALGAALSHAELAFMADGLSPGTGPQLPRDPVMEELLHPRGVARGRAPDACLVVFDAGARTGRLLSATRVTGLPPGSRLHVEENLLFLSLPPDCDAHAQVTQVLRGCPEAQAGMALVEKDATDWVFARRLALATLTAARRAGLRLGCPSDPDILAALVAAEATEAVHDLVAHLPVTPIAAIREFDRRASAQLEVTLTAWCHSGFDVGLTATRLHVHPNTLRYRLRRAGEVSGLDLNDHRHRLAAQLLLPG